MTRTRSWPAVLPFVALGLAGLFLGGYLLCGERTPPEEEALAAKPRLRSGSAARVPRLRVPKIEPASPRGVPGPSPARADPSAPPSVRLAPLLALYTGFEQDTDLGPTTLREVRQILHRAQQSVLGGQRREQVLLEIAGELRTQLSAEEVDRVLTHPFPQQLLGWDEPLFEATARGIVNVRKDALP